MSKGRAWGRRYGRDGAPWPWGSGFGVCATRAGGVGVGVIGQRTSVTMDNAIYTGFWTPTTWSGFAGLGGTFAVTPTVTYDAPNDSLVMIGKGTNQHHDGRRSVGSTWLFSTRSPRRSSAEVWLS